MLPESKNDHPKCLYLDQNKWIDLARAHHGKPEGAKFQICLESVRAAVKSGKLIVPFSMVNAIESMISRDLGRRQRLAEFMVELSGNTTISPEHVVAQMEIINATRQVFGLPALESPRKSIVKVGIVHAIGMETEIQNALPPAIGATFAAEMKSAAMTVAFLLRCGNNRDYVKRARNGEANAQAIFQSDRAVTEGMSSSARLKAELHGLFSKNPEYRVALESTLATIGRTVNDFKSAMKSDDNVATFVAAIPNFDVFITLRMLRDLDKDREVEHNDIRDLDWLSVAVPYSNIVVSEQYWGKKVLANGIAAKYSTVLLTNLQELPAHLLAMGCIG
jgi:hypothetical protein